MIDKDQRITRKLMAIAVLGFVGAIAGYFVGKALGEMSVDTGYDLSTSVIVALGVAVVYLGTGGLVMVGTVAPRFGEKVLNVEDADEIQEVKTMVLHAGSAFLLWGAALGVIALAGPGSTIAAIPAFAIAVVAIAAGTYFAFASYRHSDELMMAVNQESAVWAYGLVAVVVGGWAMAAHVELFPPPAPLDIISAIYALVLLATFIATGRRGMLNLR